MKIQKFHRDRNLFWFLLFVVGGALPNIAAAQAVRSALDFAYHVIYEQTFSRSTFTGDKKQAAVAEVTECKELSGVVLDIFGNPFRPPKFNPTWRTSTVLALAQAIYDERTFDRLPDLAEALAEGGCDNEEILSHLRGLGPHVRGCWAVDLILGKQ